MKPQQPVGCEDFIKPSNAADRFFFAPYRFFFAPCRFSFAP